MLSQQAGMRHAQSLLWALEGVKVTPPKVLQDIVDGLELLGPAIQPAAEDPSDLIVSAAAEGKLTPKSLDDLLAKAAAASATNGYRQAFRHKADKAFLRRFHSALVDGAADQVLNGIRPQFEAAAKDLAAARAAVDLDATPQRLLNVTASPEEQTAWGRLPELVRQISQLSAIAATFGPTADLAVIDGLTKNDNLLHLEWIDDRALMCTEGNIVTASNTFRRPNPHWQTSPWLRVPLKLATIAEAQEKIREAVEEDFNAREALRSGRGTLTDQGFVPDTRANPHQPRDLAEAQA
jgi:hypothetical protein